jgi:hypothetical protein
MLPNFLTIRNLLEQARRLSGVVVEAPQAKPERLRKFTAIRLPAGLVRDENRKRAPGTRDVSQVRLMVGHVTDVRHGFGVQRWGPDGLQVWADRLRKGDVPSVSPGDPLSLLEDIRREFGALPDKDMVAVLALCSRYAQTPYHRIASQKLGEIENRPLQHRTYAAGAGNGGVSMAVDVHHTEGIRPELAAAGRNMVVSLYDDLRAAGVEGPIVYAPHGAFSPSRWNDTHREAHLSVFKPAVMRLREEGEDVSIGYEIAGAGGRAITTRDDPEAHFDTKGRRIRTPEGTPI